MIKKYLTLILFCSMFQLSWGQKALLKEANKAFQENDFHTAIADYTMLENPDLEAKKNLADSYYNLGNMQEAAIAYENCLSASTSLPKEFILRYADAEKANNNYERANEILSKYAEKPVNIRQKLALNEENLPLLYDLKLLNDNSEDAEFGPALLDGRLIFSSDKNASRPIFKRTQQPYLDLYSAKVSDNKLTDITLFSEAINTSLHEGSATFTKDGKTMYFTRTNDNYQRINSIKIAVLQLYRADFEDGKWQNVEKLSINADSYSMAHPALSADDKTLYFTSDMPGGYGAGDIYKVELLEDNFGTPVNLGPTVNSEMQEQFPYISDNGNLYFASDRFTGLGGLDLYRSDYKAGNFEEAYNLGTTINSNRDDFSLIFDKQNATGYFSSNRSGTDKIYYFTAQDHRKRQLSGIVSNAETKNPLKQAKISLFEDENRVNQQQTDTDGSYSFTLLPGKNYRLEAEKQGFNTEMQKLTVSKNDSLRRTVNMPLEPVKNVLAERNIDNIYFDFDKAVIRPEAAKVLDGLAAFMLENPEIKIAISSYTDAVGSARYNKLLSEKRARATQTYLKSKGIEGTRIMSMGYGEQDLLVDTSEYPEKDAKVEKNRRSEFIIVKD